MASSNAVLRKKLEELEAQVAIPLQNLMQRPLHDLPIYQFRRKVEYIKTLLAAETESSSTSQDKAEDLKEIIDKLAALEKNFINWADMPAASREEPDHLEEIAERLSFIENNFHDFNASDATDGPLCKYCLNGEEDDDDDDDMKIKEELEAIVARANIERIVRELTEKAKREEKRRGGWLRGIATMGAAVVVGAVGLAVAGFRSMEESVYLVPT